MGPLSGILRATNCRLTLDGPASGGLADWHDRASGLTAMSARWIVRRPALWTVFVVATVLILGLVPPSPTIAQVRRGGSFTAAATAEAVSFHPYTTTDTASGGYQGLVYGGSLWIYDPDSLQPIPEGASSWYMSDDGLTYTFTLRD